MDILRTAIPAYQLDQDRLLEYYKNSGWLYPRWFMSPTNFNSSGAYYIAVEYKNCLSIIKWRKLPWCHYAMFPPISITKDREVENEVMLEYRKAGIDFYITNNDIERLNIDRKEITLLKNKEEYIYRVGDVSSLRGSKWSTLRYYKNQFERMGGQVRYTTPPIFTEELQQIAYNWAIHFDQSASLPKALKGIGKWNDSFSCVLSMADKPFVWSVAENVGIGYIHTYAYKDYMYTPVKKATMLEYYYTSKYIAEMAGEDTILNLGSCFHGWTKTKIAGLIEHKKSLKPIDIVDTYKLPALKKIQPDAYMSILK